MYRHLGTNFANLADHAQSMGEKQTAVASVLTKAFPTLKHGLTNHFTCIYLCASTTKYIVAWTYDQLLIAYSRLIKNAGNATNSYTIVWITTVITSLQLSINIATNNILITSILKDVPVDEATSLHQLFFIQNTIIQNLYQYKNTLSQYL